MTDREILLGLELLEPLALGDARAQLLFERLDRGEEARLRLRELGQQGARAHGVLAGEFVRQGATKAGLEGRLRLVVVRPVTERLDERKARLGELAIERRIVRRGVLDLREDGEAGSSEGDGAPMTPHVVDGALEREGARVASRGVLGHRGARDRGELGRDLGRVLARLRVERRDEHLMEVLSLVRRLAGEHLVQRGPEQEDIGARIDLRGIGGHHLRRHVGRRAHQLGLRVVSAEPKRDAPVGQVHVPVGSHQHVVGLDVAVDHPLLVREMERSRDRHQHVEVELELAGGRGEDAGPAGVLGVLEELRPRHAVDALHHEDEAPVLVEPHRVHGHHVRVLEAAHHRRLGAEHLGHPRVGHLLLEALDRHVAAQRTLPRQVHASHPALAEDAEHLEVGGCPSFALRALCGAHRRAREGDAGQGPDARRDRGARAALQGDLRCAFLLGGRLGFSLGCGAPPREGPGRDGLVEREVVEVACWVARAHQPDAERPQDRVDLGSPLVLSTAHPGPGFMGRTG